MHFDHRTITLDEFSSIVSSFFNESLSNEDLYSLSTLFGNGSIKKQSYLVKRFLQAKGINIGIQATQEFVAKVYGFSNFKALKKKLKALQLGDSEIRVIRSGLGKLWDKNAELILNHIALSSKPYPLLPQPYYFL